jgi:hypothetical protein
MLQSGYKGVSAFTKGLIYEAGWCEFYYTPIENIDIWPTLSPLTQELNGEPILKAGTSWYGPINIANQQLGYKESQEKSTAGVYYKIQLDGFYPGDGRASRVNLENMPYHRFVIVGKQRAGGIFLLIGSPDGGLDFSHNFLTGRGNTATISDFIFSGDLLNKAFVLPSFGSQTSTPMPGDTGGGSGGTGGTGGTGDIPNNYEIITFTDQASMSIYWTDARKLLFGNMPIIEVWFFDGLYYQLANIPIKVDALPPSISVITIDFTGITSGFILIK